jgi:CheY-like chemotaxis protein
MDEETLNRIFEPFFTTRKGAGSGLGLATVYGIVKQSNGHVNVQSELGIGTTFEIYLIKEEGTPEVRSVSHIEDATETPRTILLVDDNEAVRKATSALLQARGFEVLEASNGMEAIHLSDQFSKPIHLLITDVVMPKMSGASLARELSKRRPSLKILFMSGYSEESVITQSPGATFLQKPFSIGTFFGRINELLDPQANW